MIELLKTYNKDIVKDKVDDLFQVGIGNIL